MLEETLIWIGLTVLGTAVGWAWVPAVAAGRFDRNPDALRSAVRTGQVLAVVLWLVIPACVIGAGVAMGSRYVALFASAYLTAAWAPVFILAIWQGTRVLGAWVAVSWYLVALPVTAWVVWDSGGLEGQAEFDLLGEVVWLASVGLTGALLVPGWFLAAVIDGFSGAIIYGG